MKIDKIKVFRDVLLVCFGVFSNAAADQRDDEDPYLIFDLRGLQNMSSDLKAHYALANDIDANRTEGWNDGAGFDPIGTGDNGFTDNFGDNEISGLYIDRPSTDEIRLFGAIHTDAEVRGVGVVGHIISKVWT